MIMIMIMIMIKSKSKTLIVRGVNSYVCIVSLNSVKCMHKPCNRMV